MDWIQSIQHPPSSDLKYCQCPMCKQFRDPASLVNRYQDKKTNEYITRMQKAANQPVKPKGILNLPAGQAFSDWYANEGIDIENYETLSKWTIKDNNPLTPQL